MCGVSAFQFIPQNLQADITARTSVVDVTVYLQQWLDYCAENSRKAFLPAGIYNTSGPLWAPRTKRPSGFYTLNIEGEGGGYVQASSQSTIVTSHLDGPALIISRARGVRFAGINIQGQNIAPSSVLGPRNVPGDYQSPGVRVNRYSPHCGIAIDPTLGPPPAGPDQYPGLESEYQGEAGGSKNIIIENVSISNFLVGLAVSPGNSVQAEVIIMDRCRIGGCEYAASYGQPQSRANAISHTDIEFCRVGVTTITHGKQQGAVQRLVGLQVVQVWRFLQSFDTFSTCAVTDCYFEGVLRLAQWGAGFTQIKAPLSFNGCDFHFDNDFTLLPNIYYEPFLLESAGVVLFNSCWFNDTSIGARVINFAATFNTARFRFNGCNYLGNWALNNNASLANQRSNTFVTISENAQLNQATISSYVDVNLLNVISATTDGTIKTVAIDETHPFTHVGPTITFTAQTQPEADKAVVGDVIYWNAENSRVPCFEITDVTALVITARYLFNPDFYSEDFGLVGDTIELIDQPRTTL